MYKHVYKICVQNLQMLLKTMKKEGEVFQGKSQAKGKT